MFRFLWAMLNETVWIFFPRNECVFLSEELFHVNYKYYRATYVIFKRWGICRRVLAGIGMNSHDVGWYLKVRLLGICTKKISMINWPRTEDRIVDRRYDQDDIKYDYWKDCWELREEDKVSNV